MNYPAPEAAPEISPAVKRLFLIDGYGFVFRAFHAVRELTAPDGTPVNAVYGFTNMLLKQRQKVCPNNGDYMVVIFDAGRKSFRNDIYPAYKAHRPPAPPELIPQFALVREVVAALGLPSVEMEGYEADDLIATYTRQGQAEGMEVTIISSDKDLMQLVCGNVQLYDAMKDIPIREKEVLEKFGVEPCRVLDVLALMGDSSDNIPGVPGIGPKTAAELILQYGDLDGILAATSQIKQAKRRETLEQNAEQARLSRELARLKEDVPVTAMLHDFTVREETPEEVLPFLRRMGFKSLIAKFENKHGVSAADVQSAENKQQEAVKNYVTLTPEQLPAWLESATSSGTLAVLPVKGGLALSAVLHHSVYIAFEEKAAQDDLFGGGAGKEDKTAITHALLQTYFQDITLMKIGHDVKGFRFQVSGSSVPQPYDDTLVMSYTLDGARHSHDLSNLAQMHLGLMLPEDVSAETACARVDALLQLHQHFRQRLFREKMLTLYETIERPLVAVLAAVEGEGIKVDALFLKNLSEEFGGKIATLEKEIHALAGKEFLVSSPKQLGEILFDDMGIGGGKKLKKSGTYSTDSSVLETLAAEGHSIAGKVLEWRGLSKLRSTYTEALQREINPKTGRVHTTFAMAATSTGRLSSINPNLQNIPIRSEEGRRIRQAFIAETGNVLISADYSQIELRLLAHMADIEPLKTAFRNGEDIHAKTAAQVFGLALAEVTPAQRRAAKAINFGIIYGQSAFGLAAGLGIPQGEAKQYIAAYFKEYPGIQAYMERTKQQAHEQGYVTTLYGRKCYLPGINASGPQRAFAERAAINAPLQGTAADIIKKAMVVIHRRLQETSSTARMVLQVHDELLLEAPAAETETVIALVKREMEQVVNLSVPLTVEANAGSNWGEVH